VRHVCRRDADNFRNHFLERVLHRHGRPHATLIIFLLTNVNTGQFLPFAFNFRGELSFYHVTKHPTIHVQFQVSRLQLYNHPHLFLYTLAPRLVSLITLGMTTRIWTKPASIRYLMMKSML